MEESMLFLLVGTASTIGSFLGAKAYFWAMCPNGKCCRNVIKKESE